MDMKNIPWFMFYILFLFLSLKSNISHGADTISANQSLYGDHTIISAGGVFQLGFFKPGNSSNFYIGIWYKKVTLQTPVWVANTETPISDEYSSELKILNGNLVLLNESQTPIWFTNLNSTASNSVEAVLLDTRNLVLRNGSNPSGLVWQSFDYPTDTWLPSGKLGLIKKHTKTNQILTSWKNSEDPTPSLFSIGLDPIELGGCLLWNRSRQYWRTGTSNGQSFSLIPKMWLRHNFNISFVSNENESYFTYFAEDPSFIISRFVMDLSRQLKQFIWFDSDNTWNTFWAEPRHCEVYALCGTFPSYSENSMPICNCLKGYEPKSMKDWNLEDHFGGCVRKTPFQCGNGSSATRERDGFLAISSVKLPEYPQTINAGSAAQCESTCLNNCFCTAYAYYSNGCSIWFGDLLNLQQLAKDDSSGKNLSIMLAAFELPRSNNNTGMFTGIVAGLVAGIVTLLGLVLVVFLRWRRSVRAIKVVGISLVPFGFRDLQNATKHFSKKLGGHYTRNCL